MAERFGGAKELLGKMDYDDEIPEAPALRSGKRARGHCYRKPRSNPAEHSILPKLLDLLHVRRAKLRLDFAPGGRRRQVITRRRAYSRSHGTAARDAASQLDYLRGFSAGRRSRL